MIDDCKKKSGIAGSEYPVVSRCFFDSYSELFFASKTRMNGARETANVFPKANYQDTLPFENGNKVNGLSVLTDIPKYETSSEADYSNIEASTRTEKPSTEINIRQTDLRTATEYLLRDVEYPQSAVRDQARALRDLMAFKTVGKVADRATASVIVVASGKGGVGKSTVALNLGLALAKQKKRVVIVDGDLGLANLDTMLGVRPRKTLWHYIHAGDDLSEIMIRDTFGIDLLPGGTGLEDMANLSPAHTDRLISALERIESQSDLIIIDTGAGINHRVITFAAAADRVVLVAAPESTSILDAYGLIKVTCSHHPAQQFKVVMCRVLDGGEAKRHFEALASVATKYTDAKMELAGYIPVDENVKASVNQHQPLLVLYPRTDASLAFVKLAGHIAHDLENSGKPEADGVKEPAGGKSGFIRRLLGAIRTKS